MFSAVGSSVMSGGQFERSPTAKLDHASRGGYPMHFRLYSLAQLAALLSIGT